MKNYKTWGKSRSLRLKEFDYTSTGFVYHITIGTEGKKEFFTNPSLNQKIIKILKDAVDLYGYKILSYCLMPDHLHVLLQGGNSPRSLNNFVRGFKSFVTKSTGSKMWQKGFYEHILRNEENVKDVGIYILNNPVRKGLVNESNDYPWCEWLEKDFTEVR
jgi:REP element-mobilizing transposase RayT